MRAVSLRRTFALGASLLALGALPATAAATSTETEVDAAVEKAVEYVRAQQDTTTGSIPGFGGDWVTTALVAAGVDAAGFRGSGPGDPSLQDHWLNQYTLPTFTEEPPGGSAIEYARSTLIAHAAGLDPARLSAGSNQPAQLASRWNPVTGSFGEASTYYTVFSILALQTTPLPRWALEPAVAFLRRNQHDDGGWTYTPALSPAAQAEPSEEDITGAAVAAMCGAGVPSYDPAVAAALDRLRGRLISGTGGIEYLWGPPNANTNGWVVSGLNACGIDPQSPEWTAAGATPIDFILSLQVGAGAGEGGFGYSSNSTADLFATQDALRAIAGAGLVVPPQSARTPPAVAAGTPVPHVLAIELAPGNVRFCKVTAPQGAPLTEVLAAAAAVSHPAGCVPSLEVSDGKVEAIGGVAPESDDEAWLARLDRGPSRAAAGQPVGFGEVIALRIGRDPSTEVGVQGPAGPGGQAAQGPAGVRGKPGQRGKRGAKGRAGKAKKRCRVSRGRGRHRSHRGTSRGTSRKAAGRRGCSGRRR